MKLIRYILFSIAALLLIVLLFFLAAGIADYRPGPTELIEMNAPVKTLTDSSYTAIIWNVGYGGLDASMDFFYDGGTMVRPDREQSEKNLRHILEQVKEFSDADFVLLQEVDRDAKRSHSMDLYDSIRNVLPGMHSAFALNYQSFFVPLPLRDPMGRVASGLQSLSAHIPESVTRYQFPGNYSWPTRHFMLDRCFMVNRYPMEGKELVIVNTHNSAYDDGSLREKQMNYMSAFLVDEYAQGNYVVVGGDWNQTPPGFEPSFNGELFDTEDLTYLPAGYPDTGWTWVYDTTTPTNRRLKIPYEKGSCATTVIDLYLLSPNISADSIHTLDMGFKYSDHHPVRLVFSPN